MLMLGKSGIGAKTTRLKGPRPGLPPLFLDIEAGDLAVDDWAG
jgi:hypothetical protein